jgi:hypothetical protein
MAIDSVAGVADAVPSTHGVPDGNVIAWFTVHVSPGVANVVGDVVPFVQLERLVTLPGPVVTHAVAWAADMPHSNKAQQKNVRSSENKDCTIVGMFLRVNMEYDKDMKLLL